MTKIKQDQHTRPRYDHRAPQTRILIVCGGKTELRYFNDLKKDVKLASISVEKTRGDKSEPQDVIDIALEKREEDHERVFCVCDHDNNPDWQTACQQMRDRGLTPIISIPCFEYWVLLHYESISRAFDNCRKLIRELKRKYFHDYHKADPRLYDKLADKLATAKSNAAVRCGGKCACAQTASSSYTNMHEMVEYLLDMKTEGEGGE